MAEEISAPRIARLTEERLQLLASLPDGYDIDTCEKRNLGFVLRTRSGISVRAYMVAGRAWSVMRRALVPDRLMKVYLRRRYNIGGVDKSVSEVPGAGGTVADL